MNPMIEMEVAVTGGGLFFLWSTLTDKKSKWRTRIMLGMLKTRVSRIIKAPGDGLVALRGRAKKGNHCIVGPMGAEILCQVTRQETSAKMFFIDDGCGELACVDPEGAWLAFAKETEHQTITTLKSEDTVYVFGPSKRVPEAGGRPGVQLLLQGPGLLITTKNRFVIFLDTIFGFLLGIALVIVGVAMLINSP